MLFNKTMRTDGIYSMCMLLQFTNVTLKTHRIWSKHTEWIPESVGCLPFSVLIMKSSDVSF